MPIINLQYVNYVTIKMLSVPPKLSLQIYEREDHTTKHTSALHWFSSKSFYGAYMSIYCYLWLAAKSNAGGKWYINLSLCVP